MKVPSLPDVTGNSFWNVDTADEADRWIIKDGLDEYHGYSNNPLTNSTLELRPDRQANMFDYHYRLFLIRFLAASLVPPSALTFIALRAVEIYLPTLRINLFARIAAYICGAPLYWAVKNAFNEWRDAANAKRLGAKMVPRLRGKRWGDVDLVQR